MCPHVYDEYVLKGIFVKQLTQAIKPPTLHNGAGVILPGKRRWCITPHF